MSSVDLSDKEKGPN